MSPQDEFMRNLERISFVLNGGWSAVFWHAVFGAVKWFSIGALVHLGWRAVA